jgi:diguanylate cyclase (GGDEF)-like protein/PAS domain S-box-containing protein
VSDVLRLKNEENSRPLHDVLEDVLSFLTHWLAFHILESDKHMAKVSLAVQSGASLEQAKQQAHQEMSGATEVLIKTVLSMYDALSRRTLQMMKEVIERQKTERKANALVQRNQLLMQSTPEGIHIMDEQGNIIEANDAFCRLLGYTQEEVLQLSVFDFDAKMTVDELRANIKKLQNGHAKFETVHRRKDGSLVEVEIIVSGVELDGLKCLFALSRDITERKQAEEMIRNLAFYDTLTHLPNRRLLMDRFKQALASCVRNVRKGALLFIDMDNFKALNDTLGHNIGDILLQQVAQRLESCVREGDTVARLGGDEFVVMLEDLSAQDIEAVAQTKAVGEKILVTLNQPYQLATHEHHSTPSIGVTLFSNHEQTQDELLKQADIAMYQAKKAGRNTLRFYEPAMQVK